MSSTLSLSSFYPDNSVVCLNDLPFEDGTYEVYERNVILNIFQIKNHRIQYHIVYNVETKKRLMTWSFEYVTNNGEQVHNVWRQTMNANKCEMYASSHWNLYPEEHKQRLAHHANFEVKFENFINHVGKCQEENKCPI